jgi:hypothetical protein
MKKMFAAMTKSLAMMLLTGMLIVISGTQLAQAQCLSWFTTTNNEGVKIKCVLRSSFNNNCLYECSPTQLLPNVPG